MQTVQNDHVLNNAMLLISTHGRASGETESNFLAYRRDGDRYIVAATSNKDRFKPDWYLNLKSDPVVEIEVGGARQYAIATTPIGKERARLWSLVDEISDRTQAAVPRGTSVVTLTPLGNV